MIDVIITSYNMGSTIKEAIDSVILCEDVNRVIVVNDGSDDNTLDIISKLNYDKLDIISYNENMGFGYARNKGLEYSKSEYFIFLDADDVIVGLDSLINEFKNKYYGYDLVSLPVVDIKLQFIAEYIPNEPFFRENFTLGLHKTIIKRKFIQDYKYINNKDDMLPEGWFNACIITKIPKCVRLKSKKCFYIWRQTSKSMSRGITRKDINRCLYYLNYFRFIKRW